MRTAPPQNFQEPDPRLLASSSPMVISLASASPKPPQRASLSRQRAKPTGGRESSPPQNRQDEREETISVAPGVAPVQGLHSLRFQTGRPDDCPLPPRPDDPAISETGYFICRISLRVCRTSSRICARSAIASRVKRPCLSAFLLPRGAPDPNAPPCMRQRFLPRTDGDLHGLPERVLAPQRRLESIGPVLRL